MSRYILKIEKDEKWYEPELIQSSDDLRWLKKFAEKYYFKYLGMDERKTWYIPWKHKKQVTIVDTTNEEIIERRTYLK